MPLDNIYDRETPDTRDDCDVHDGDRKMKDRGPLDRAYRASGWEKGMMEDLTSRWDRDVVSVDLAGEAGTRFFSIMYNSANPPHPDE